MKPVSYNGSDPVHIRLRNIGTAGFEYKLEEWDYLDGNHTTERMFWYAVAPVAGQIPTASRAALSVQTGRVSVDTNGTSVNFDLATDLAFQNQPIVLAQTQTYNGKGDAVITRVDGVNENGFGIRLQEQEDGDYHQTESVGYIAIEVPGGGGLLSLDDLSSDVLDTLGLDIVQDQLLTEFEARRPSKAIADSPSRARTIPFTLVNNGDGFERNPRVIANTQTRRGPQPANLRRTALSRESMDLFVQEEQSKDDETTHAAEDIGFLAVGGNGLIPGTIANINTSIL